MKVVQINRNILATKDASQYRKSYYFSGDGSRYVLCGLETKSVPDEVANQWTTDDSEIEVISIT